MQTEFSGRSKGLKVTSIPSKGSAIILLLTLPVKILEV